MLQSSLQRIRRRMQQRVWLQGQRQTLCPAMWHRLTMWISLSRKPSWQQGRIRKRGELCWLLTMRLQQGVKALDRNLQDSRAKFQTQRNQVDADEAKALDNQVLYAEARGDRGGIGKVQYGGIQNTAATNRQVVNSAEVKLQTDTARQIADLRAQGEFEKADKVLEISNKYLTELQNLEKWAKEKNVGVQEFNAKLRQWENEYLLKVGEYLTDTELQAAKLFGVAANGAETADYRNAVADRYAEGARAMMNAGIVPSASQLEALGWTPQQYWIYRMANGGKLVECKQVLGRHCIRRVGLSEL